MAQRIGFIGAGLMGHGMAKNIVEKGYPLTVSAHRNRAPVDDLIGRGATEATQETLAATSTIIFLTLPGSPQVADAVGRMTPHLRPGTVIVDCSTSDPTVTERLAAELGLDCDFRQTNHEGVMVDWIQEAFTRDAAVVINPAGFSFGCVPVLDALKLLRKPLIEVHLTNIHQRPLPYTYSTISQVATGVICGLGPQGYLLAVRAVAEALEAKRAP